MHIYPFSSLQQNETFIHKNIYKQFAKWTGTEILLKKIVLGNTEQTLGLADFWPWRVSSQCRS